jgi:hypothetical protein
MSLWERLAGVKREAEGDPLEPCCPTTRHVALQLVCEFEMQTSLHN